MDIEYQLRSVLTGNLVYQSSSKRDVIQFLTKRKPSTHEVYWVNPISGRVRAIDNGKLFVKQNKLGRGENVKQTELNIN